MSVSIATQHPMTDTAEPAKKRRRDAEGDESEESAPPRVKQEYKSDAGGPAKVKRLVELESALLDKRKAAVAAPAQE